MRRPTSVLTTAILGIALMVPDFPAQQLPPTGASRRPARHPRSVRRCWPVGLLPAPQRLGLHQLPGIRAALGFFREAETRKAELSKDEIKSLYQGIAKAQDGMRDPSNGNTRSYAKSGKRRPGALAYAGPPAPANLPATAPVLATQQPPVLTPPPEPDSIQLTSNSTTVPAARAATLPTAPTPAPAPVPSQAPMLAPQMPALTSTPVQAQSLALGSSPTTSNSPDLALTATPHPVPPAPPATTAVNDAPSPLPASLHRVDRPGRVAAAGASRDAPRDP